jgi:methyl-accepting chemotaxis protein
VNRLFSKLRVGEKIGLSTGLVGVLFLAVIWHYHLSLQTAIEDYQRLNDIFGARETLIFEIQTELSDARRAEADFLISQDETYVADVDRHVDRLREKASALALVDEESRQTPEEIDTLIQTYQQRFQAIAEAWRVKGLDHDSGLQGAFRNSIHQLEAQAGNFKVGRLYLELLQIRRAEKDLGLRREVQYQEKARQLIQGFRDLVASSELTEEVKSRLYGEVSVYAEAFENYAEQVLGSGETGGGKGPFRQAAHRIEDILTAHFVPDLETNILQLRRREKDYLLRSDHRYVQMVGAISQIIREQVDNSDLSERNKGLLSGLLAA